MDTPEAATSLAGFGSFELHIRGLMTGREDLPDWMHMKAIELSRAADQARDYHDSLLEFCVVNQIFSILGLERRIAALEAWQLDQERWNVWIEEIADTTEYEDDEDE